MKKSDFWNKGFQFPNIFKFRCKLELTLALQLSFILFLQPWAWPDLTRPITFFFFSYHCRELRWGRYFDFRACNVLGVNRKVPGKMFWGVLCPVSTLPYWEGWRKSQLLPAIQSFFPAVHTQGRQFENDTVATRMEKPIDARPSGLSAVTRTRKWIPPLPKRAPIFIDSGWFGFLECWSGYYALARNAFQC